MHPHINWILSRQVALAIVLAAVLGVIIDVNAAVSAVVGGSIGIVANLGYVLRALRMSGGNNPVKVFQAQAAGEGFKFLLTFIGFALVFLGYKGVAVLPLFLGYASTFVIFWVALLKQR